MLPNSIYKTVFLPENPRAILEEALSKSIRINIDEKSSNDNPSVATRASSKLTFEEAYKIINENKPHWLASFRDESYWNRESYWDFGGCNIASNDYGEVFIFIHVKLNDGLEILEKYNLI